MDKIITSVNFKIVFIIFSNIVCIYSICLFNNNEFVTISFF